MEEDSKNHITFVDPETNEYDECNTKEGWEKLVTTKLFDLIFGAPGTEEPRSNQVLKEKIQSYAWIEERHLDLSIHYSLALEVVQAELLKLNGYRSPRDKLIILQNVMQLIADLIKKKIGTEGNNDALLPTLILVILRTNPPDLISNVKYITRFRNPTEMEKGNNQFCMTTMMGAISFIYNISPKSLTLSEQEKDRMGGDLISQSTKDEIKQFTNQVSGFFSSLVKEVKTTADELINNVSPSPTSPSNIFGTTPETPTSQQFAELSLEERNRLRQEREQYDLDLAIAISLSEAQNQESNLVDIDSYTPMTTAPRRQSIDEPDVELERRNK
jgi:hypothetical protein